MTHPREQFEAKELATVLSHWDLGIIESMAEFPKGSHRAPKMIVVTDRGKFLLKRRPRGREDPYRVAFAHELQLYLAGRNFPLPHLIGTKETNNSMLKIGDAIYELFEFIEGGPYDGSHEATAGAGRTLGLYHKLVRDYHPPYEPPKGHYHDSKNVVESIPRMHGALVHTASARGREEELTAVLAELLDAYSSAAQSVNELGLPDWEMQIVHSDWHPGNMLFQEGHVVAVLDYDAARIQARVVDIANGCLQFSMVTGSRDASTWEARTDEARAHRFLRGYDETNELTQAELAAVPLLMQEAMIAQAVHPILKSGTFAGLDGFEFLKTMMRKIRWLQENVGRLELDSTKG